MAELHNDYIPRGPFQTILRFYEPPEDGSIPYQYAHQPPEGHPVSNCKVPPTHLELSDIRGHEGEFSLDKDGVQTLHKVSWSTPYSAFFSDEEVRLSYYPEVEKLLLSELVGASKVIIFEHVVRREKEESHGKPLYTVHADQSAKAAEARVRLHVPDEKERSEVLQGRYRIVNVWRPLNGPVQSCPLAFTSGSTVVEEGLIPIEYRRPDRNGEILGVRFSAQQKWMYWSGMRNDEALLLKCYDSRKGVAKQVPHSACRDPRSPPGVKGRESIEIRALVVG